MTMRPGVDTFHNSINLSLQCFIHFFLFLSFVTPVVIIVVEVVNRGGQSIDFNVIFGID